MAKLLKSLTYLLLFLLLTSCAKLPDYALPHLRENDLDPDLLKKGFSYRKLKKSDFKAKSLPETLIQHSNTINARSCVRIHPNENSKFRVTRNNYNNSLYYFGSIEQLSVDAIMMPDCSWWNPKIPKSRAGYVLEHEQIHFALFELAARELNKEIQKQVKTYIAIQPSRQKLQDEMNAKVEEMVKSAMHKNLVEHTEFDTQTSMRFNHEKQKQWLHIVEEKLKKSMPIPTKESTGSKDKSL